VAKTLVDIDEDLLSRAGNYPRRHDQEDAVEGALQEVVDRDDRARGLAWLSSTPHWRPKRPGVVRARAA